MSLRVGCLWAGGFYYLGLGVGWVAYLCGHSDYSPCYCEQVGVNYLFVFAVLMLVAATLDRH